MELELLLSWIAAFGGVYGGFKAIDATISFLVRHFRQTSE